MTANPINECIEAWHQCIGGGLDSQLEDLIHEECVFVSPIIFTPQVGRDLTIMYLRAAGSTLIGTATSSPGSGDTEGGFRYTKQVLAGHHAVLEFETTIEDKYVNGVDIITCDDSSLITEFRVMIRPLQAVNLVHAQMKAMLEAM